MSSQAGSGLRGSWATAWRGRRVLLTGHTGFKGSWMSLWLAGLGARVTGFSLAPPTEPNLFSLVGAAADVDSVIGDIRDLPALEAAVARARPEIIIHMAAQSVVRASYTDPLTTYSTNVMGTANLLDVARRCPDVQAILVVTSDKCYENREQIWAYREHDRMGGHDPYSNSKGCAELVVAAFRDSYFRKAGVAVATARAGNVIGGGDWTADRLVPDAMRAFLARRTLDIRNPIAVRPWQHVLEPLQGYLLLGARLLGDEAGAYAGGWNFGPGHDSNQPVSDVVDALAACWGGGATWRQVGDPADLHEATLLHLDSTKANIKLGWTPVHTYKTAVALTVDWFKAYEAGADLRAITQAQIEAYMNHHPRAA
ncbi:CDP-glucose 4,6-dehydratase [Nitrospirillum amazonense]|nr:CDP-glucose 4,6-dehydratase [Nitrospirillum amazonense]